MAASNALTQSSIEYSEVLTDEHIAQFLATRSWTCQADRGFDQVWLQPGAQGERVAHVLLPREKTFVDYRRRLDEALSGIAAVYDWGLSQLAEQVAAIHADLFYVRVDQTMADGTIPLRQATALLENIDSMIRSAAIMAASPSHSGIGRVPEIVTAFLKNDLRMGHTKHGSFIITVAARLEEPDLPRAELPAPSGGLGHDTNLDYKPSFTRQVMTTLSRSLEVTRRFAERGDDFVELEAAVEQGLRLPMVQALREIGEADGLRSLDLSFEWAAAEPVRGEMTSHITLGRPVLQALPDVEQRLKRVVPPKTVTLAGPVIELKRGDEDVVDEEQGEIVVRADVDGRWIKVTVPLAGADYDWAIRAHRGRLPFTVSGELAKRGRSWTLTDPIEVDHSYLEHRLSNDQAI